MRLFREMSNEQRRQFVDIEQVFLPYQEAVRQFSHSYEGAYVGTMRWVKVNNKEYLYRKYRNIQKSLGPRSPETETLKEDYTRHRGRLRSRVTQLEKRLKEMARVNQALRLGRVPTIAAKVIRALDAAGLMGRHLFVVGTNAMFAYEARAGILFGSDIIATADADLLVDARRSLRLALIDVKSDGVIGILQKADKTFTKDRTYRATNDQGYQIDLICPLDRNYLRALSTQKIGDLADDLEPAPIEGLGWLLSAPKFEAVAIGEDGYPLMLPCIDPRFFALHKLWLSKRANREPIKKRRDEAQAIAVAALCNSYFNLDFKAKELSALPAGIRALQSQLTEKAAGYLDVEDSDIPQRGW